MLVPQRIERIGRIDIKKSPFRAQSCPVLSLHPACRYLIGPRARATILQVGLAHWMFVSAYCATPSPCPGLLDARARAAKTQSLFVV
jgi:hypothetical protein